MSSDKDTSANITRLPGKPDPRNDDTQLAEVIAERDRYFQELFSESRQSYAQAMQCRRLRYELDNVYATKSWRYTAPFRRLGEWWRGLFKKP